MGFTLLWNTSRCFGSKEVQLQNLEQMDQAIRNFAESNKRQLVDS